MKMDQEKCIAEELNRGYYSANLWQYFFNKTDASGYADANLTSDSEPKLEDETDEIDKSDCITLENIPNLQLNLAEDEDNEESLGLSAEELERKISEAISTVTFEGDKDSKMEKIRNFDCKCYGRRKENSLLGTQSCSHKLSPELMYNIRMDSLAAEREWRDMRIIGHLEANRRTVVTSETTTSTKKPPTKRTHPQTTYFIGGNEVCRNTFQFLMGAAKTGEFPDEGMSSSKGSNEVISYMHHFFSNFGVGETDVDLHCDNCSGQNKNNFMLWYHAWRLGHKLHSIPSIHFLIAGHTKFAPDCGFGLIKQAFMRTRVNTLADIAKVVENSSPESHLNIPQLVGMADGRVIVKTFDWQTHLSPYFRRLPQIKSYQHFRVKDLEEFIDHYYYGCVMEGPADNPNKRKKTDSATDTQDLLSSEFSVLESINKKLEVLGMLHQEIKDLKVCEYLKAGPSGC
ncbi:hypothetical protein ABVT39_016614 [Epinephelus coioides]